MGRAGAAGLAAAAGLTLSLAPAPAAAAPVAAAPVAVPVLGQQLLPQVRVSVAPARIVVGQSATASLRGAPGERLGLWAYTLPSRTYRLVRTGTAGPTGLVSWAVRPGGDTRLYGTAAAGARASSTTVLQVRRTASSPAPTGSSPASPAGGVFSAPLRTAVRQLPVAAEVNVGYDRDAQFGGWVDADRDCRNTRHEVLAAEGRDVRLSAGGCTVVAGTWVPFYDNRTYTSPAQLQIDHLLPVAEAWGSGARAWSQARRMAFYNDLGVGYALNAMPAALNQAKQASGPEQWLPPTNQCRYIEVWTAMKHRWALSADPAERDALVRLADACPDHPVTVPRA